MLQTRLLMPPEQPDATTLWPLYEATIVPYLSAERRRQEDALAKEAHRIASAFVALGPLVILKEP